jgi:hypothetical protein
MNAERLVELKKQFAEAKQKQPGDPDYWQSGPPVWCEKYISRDDPRNSWKNSYPFRLNVNAKGAIGGCGRFKTLEEALLLFKV